MTRKSVQMKHEAESIDNVVDVTVYHDANKPRDSVSKIAVEAVPADTTDFVDEFRNDWNLGIERVMAGAEGLRVLMKPLEDMYTIAPE